MYLDLLCRWALPLLSPPAMSLIILIPVSQSRWWSDNFPSLAGPPGSCLSSICILSRNHKTMPLGQLFLGGHPRLSMLQFSPMHFTHTLTNTGSLPGGGIPSLPLPHPGVSYLPCPGPQLSTGFLGPGTAHTWCLGGLHPPLFLRDTPRCPTMLESIQTLQGLRTQTTPGLRTSVIRPTDHPFLTSPCMHHHNCYLFWIVIVIFNDDIISPPQTGFCWPHS